MVRGTRFSLSEALQMGTFIPVYVYDDLELLPYRNTKVRNTLNITKNSVSGENTDGTPRTF